MDIVLLPDDPERCEMCGSLGFRPVDEGCSLCKSDDPVNRLIQELDGVATLIVNHHRLPQRTKMGVSATEMTAIVKLVRAGIAVDAIASCFEITESEVIEIVEEMTGKDDGNA